MIMKGGNNSYMKTLITSFYMILLFLPFIFSGYFEWNVLLIPVFFYIYQWMIEQYYSLNQKRFEFKDCVFAFCFMIISVLLFRLFGYSFNMNQIMFIFLISILCVIQVGCNHRIHVEIA